MRAASPGRLFLRLLIALAVALPQGAWAAADAAPAGSRVVLPAGVTPDAYELTVVPDAAQLRFKGSVTITLHVRRATRRIVLNALDLEVDAIALDGKAAAPVLRTDAQRQELAMDFGRALAVGAHRLHIDYRGRINREPTGLFALDYDSPAGPQRALYTQFEAGDARRFLPCWDEPGRRATYALTVVAPAAQMAVSNMPVDQVGEAGAGLQRVRFRTTPAMSAYLLFLALGDFERIHRQVGSVDVGVVVRRGEGAHAQFALDAAAQLLPYYEDYFGVPYPLPKLDMVGGAGSSSYFGAMENWGAIFYFDKNLLLDPRLATEADRRNVYVAIAHELAHQWFGDLVTMAWWDDLWLNEGFAAWMETRAADHFHPEWRVWADAAAATQRGMQLDAATGTHPIVSPIADAASANDAFDAITYNKGAAVIRMLENHAGAGVFRDGVRRYMRAHAYGNTESADLWRAVGGAGAAPLLRMADDYTRHAGVPLVTVRTLGCHAGREMLTLAQARFAVDESGRDGAQRWHVPLIVRSLTGGGTQETVVSGAAPQLLPMAACGAVLANAGQYAYLRVRYVGDAQSALLQRYAALEVRDQLGVLADTTALAFAGAAPLADVMSLSAALPASADPLVWQAVIRDLLALDQRYDGLPERAAFRRHVRQLLAPLLGRLGWEGAATDSSDTAILRGQLLAALARLDDPGVIDEARRRFAGFVREPSAVAAAQRDALLEAVGASADAALWEQLRRLAAGAGDALERQQYIGVLGRAGDPQLAQRALELTLTEEVPATLRAPLIKIVAERHADLAVNFIVAHWAQVEPMVDSFARPGFAASAAAAGNDTALGATLEAYAARQLPAGGRAPLRKALAQLRYNARLRARLGEIDRWIATHDLTTTGS